MRLQYPKEEIQKWKRFYWRGEGGMQYIFSWKDERISRWTIRLPHQTVVIRKAEYAANMHSSCFLEMDGGGLIHRNQINFR